MTSLAVLILTFNEEQHIERAIRSVRDVASEIVIVDSFSKDRTVEIAESLGARVHQRAWTNYADQFQWGLDNGGITSDWTMRLDADEYIDPDLADEMRERLPVLPAHVTGATLRLKRIFWNRHIKHGGCGLTLLRLWRTGVGRIENRWMDEHIILSHGRVIPFKGRFSDHNLNDIGFFTTKHNGYATREAVDAVVREFGLHGDLDKIVFADNRAAWAKKFVKEKIYYRLPFWISTPAFFLYRYILLGGFLDGVPGLVYHGLQGGWYRFLVGVKVQELRHAMRHATTNEQRAAIIFEQTGCRV